MPLFPPSTDTSASPWHAGLAAWRKTIAASWRAASADNIDIVAAGVAYYGLLAFAPLLAATVLVFGLVADPSWIADIAANVATSLPTDAAEVVTGQLADVIETSATQKGFGLAAALALALFGARNGAEALIVALDISYDVHETRGLLRRALLGLAITAGASVAGLTAMAAITAIGALETLLPFAPEVLVVLGKALSTVLLALVAAAVAATLYRYVPDRPKASWVWITPGSAFFALAWIVLTWLFGIYVEQFGNYNATYGSVGAIVVFITWLYLSSYALLLGAELNAEFEIAAAKPADGEANAVIG